MRKFARLKGGDCLSNKYRGNRFKLKWRCRADHIWFQKSSHILRGVWCPKCSGRGIYSAKYLNEIAKQRGGKCISKKYVNPYALLSWECSFGHRWQACMNNVVNNKRWCPECPRYIKEKICRLTFETIFKEKFPNTRPTWLLNERGNKMELDGYSEKLKLAFEHQGEQHYSKGTHFIKTKRKLLRRIADDRLKRILCKRNGVTLIEIPELFTRTNVSNLKELIRSQCAKQKYQYLPRLFDKIEIDLSRLYLSDYHHKIDELRKVVHNKGGKLLTENYRGVDEKLTLQCSQGHIWDMTPYKIKSGQWCKLCMKRKVGEGKKLNIEELINIAKIRRGKLLSKNYVNARTPLKWRCERGHIWRAIADSVKNKNTWCRLCSRKPPSMQSMTFPP
jgi:hypothetical protein